MAEEKEEVVFNVTDLDALKDNADLAVRAFCERWEPMPKFDIGVETMTISQLRDAMGLRVTAFGDPFPQAEQLLLQEGFRWHWIGTQRVMLCKEREAFVLEGGDDGWGDGEEI